MKRVEIDEAREILQDLKGSEGQKEIDLALVRASEMGYEPFVAMLLKAGGNPNATDGSRTALIYAAGQVGNPEVVALLLSAGADPNLAARYEEQTALIAAAHNLPVNPDKMQVTRLLLKAGANPNQKDRQGMTAWLYTGGNSELRALLESYGAKPMQSPSRPDKAADAPVNWCTIEHGTQTVTEHHFSTGTFNNETYIKKGKYDRTQNMTYRYVVRTYESTPREKVQAALRRNGVSWSLCLDTQGCATCPGYDPSPGKTQTIELPLN